MISFFLLSDYNTKVSFFTMPWFHSVCNATVLSEIMFLKKSEMIDPFLTIGSLQEI